MDSLSLKFFAANYNSFNNKDNNNGNYYIKNKYINYFTPKIQKYTNRTRAK